MTDVVSNEHESGLTVTIKDGPGYDSTWYVIRGKSPADVADIIGAIEATGLAALVNNAKIHIQGLNVLTDTFPGAHPVAHPTTAQAEYRAGANQPPVNTQATPPGQSAPTCPHGTKVYKTNKPGAPKDWKAWMCPARQGDNTQCPPEWLK